ncbi:Transcriptional regulator, TetR family [Leucobacter sp. 7(1)]|uniref:TetR/AcrR family transcriptional regulator n=1 Tax=Leucobacter sp. 7(1) TaxID=1255613 RepID=UPI00097EC6CC|nr:TetR/AcrR family transcriptional regulator [Leucobacter sp. 7(1)]SJN08739.1 Transcriptional regulator, TetR family [Leucobacter sp. 7(1)]
MTLDAAPLQLTLRERRQLRTRQELVDALLVIIAEDGVDVATIERVSAQSGISRGTVYAHFPGGRDELLRAAYAALGERLVARSHAAVLAADDWRGQLAALARQMFALAADEHTGHFFNVSGPTLITGGAERGIGSGASVIMIEDALRAAQSDGGVDPSVDTAVTAVLLVGALREAAMRVAAGLDPADRATAAFGRLVEGLAATA